MTKNLQIRSHTRQAPVDRNAEAKECMTRLLNEYVILRDLERELSQAFEDEFGRQYANYLREVR